jgi:hypothetical protein
VVALGGDLDWQGFEIPGGSAAVRIALLRVEPETRARTLLVRFPDGWRREIAGAYEAAEEFVVLEGILAMSGATYREGDWAYVPRGLMRRATVASPSVLTLARFDGPARWIAQAEEGRTAPALHRALVPEGEAVASPLGAGRAWPLRRGELESAWLMERPEPGRPAPLDVELLDLGARVWAWVPAGAALPHLAGPCFCRTFGAGGGAP